MKFELHPSFDKYFIDADENTSELLASDSSLIAGLRQFYAFFVEELFTVELTMTPAQALLAMNAFMLYLSAIRVALSGHEAATFPLFRTALETASYSYLISTKPDLENIWLKRNASSEALKTCRKTFASAVKDAAKSIQAQDRVSEGTEKWINFAYDAAIDFGAHPNPRSVLPHIRFDHDRSDEHVGLSLIGLYSPTSFEASRSLMACLDYGLLIGLILVCSPKNQTDRLLIALGRLNSLKEDLTRDHFPNTAIKQAQPELPEAR